MVPSLYIPLEKMPLTISGKTDRRAALALLDNLPLSEARLYLNASKTLKSQPVTETEKLLQLLWSNVLQISRDEIGQRDHFLKLVVIPSLPFGSFKKHKRPTLPSR